MRRWAPRLGLVLAGAALVHVLALWLLPRAIVRRARHRIASAVGVNHVQHSPLPDAGWRRVVMPSPDLLYSACAFDVSERPLLVTARVPEEYFSISAFAANSDNFFVVNDRTAGGGPVRVVLTRNRAFRDPGGGTVVVPPSSTGVVLFRQLVLDPRELPRALEIQRSATCAPL